MKELKALKPNFAQKLRAHAKALKKGLKSNNLILTKLKLSEETIVLYESIEDACNQKNGRETIVLDWDSENDAGQCSDKTQILLVQVLVPGPGPNGSVEAYDLTGYYRKPPISP